MVVPLYKGQQQDTHIELVSPSSINDVFELKDYIDGIGNEYSDDQEQQHTYEHGHGQEFGRFVCVTNINGIVIFSNTKQLKRNDDIIEILQMKSKLILETLNEQELTKINESNTLLNGHICFITLNRHLHPHQKLRIPTILKLQLTVGDTRSIFNSDKLLIWSFKKVSIQQTNDENGFKVDEEGHIDIKYKFQSFKFVLAMKKSGNLLNVPKNLLKYIIGNDVVPQNVEDLLNIPEEFKSHFKSFDQTDFYQQRFSVSSLDLAVEESFNFKPIYSFKTRFKFKPEMIVSAKLFNPFQAKNDSELIFPVQIKYLEQEKQEEPNIPSEFLEFPEFPGFKVLGKLSESLNSSVYEAIRIFQSDTRIIIKSIHSSSNHVTNELKFYQFFCDDPIGCEFIQKPFRIEMHPNPTVYMESEANQSDLFHFINSNSFLSDEIVKLIFYQIAKAVEYLHLNFIIHRDIKVPEIIILVNWKIYIILCRTRMF